MKKHNSIIVTCLFIMALFVSNSSLAQSITADYLNVYLYTEQEQEVEVTVDLGGYYIGEWAEPYSDNASVAIGYWPDEEVYWDEVGGMYTLDSNGKPKRKIRILGKLDGVAKITLAVLLVASPGGTVVEVLELVLTAYIYLRDAGILEMPTMEQSLLSIDLLAIKED